MQRKYFISATADRPCALRRLVQGQPEQGVLDAGLSIHEAVGCSEGRACAGGLITALVQWSWLRSMTKSRWLKRQMMRQIVSDIEETV